MAGRAWVVVALALASAACSGDDKKVVQPQPSATATATAEPSVVPTATASAPPAAVTGPCDATMGLALKTAIESRHKQDLAPGMKPEGAYVCEHVAEGGAVFVPMTLQPGRCYTVLASSYPNVTELDASLKLNVGEGPVPPLVAAFVANPFSIDSDTGPNATVGRGKDCYKYPFALPVVVKAEALARTGAGPIGIQVYSK